MKHGDFTSLAGDYARFRPGYAPSVITALLALVSRPVAEIDAADVGAGTGIFTMMLAAYDLHSITAVEPNDEMRRWRDGDLVQRARRERGEEYDQDLRDSPLSLSARCRRRKR
jgi:tRNA1(Val) A37 N6-methylase TrmN6